MATAILSISTTKFIAKIAKMGKSILLATSFLLLVCAAHAENPSAGLDEACKKTPDPDFCAKLLEPSAADFADNDPKKMEFAAINATIGKVQGVRTYLVEKAVKTASNEELKEAITDCVKNFAHGVGSLNVALRELNYTGEANAPQKLGKTIPIKMIGIASAELTSCHDALKKCETAGMAAGIENADITRHALRSANESVLACSIAKAFIMP